MMSAAVASRRRVLRMRGRIVVTLNQRHDGHAGFEAGEAQGEPGKEQARQPDDGKQAAVLGEESALPIHKKMRLLEYMKDADSGNDQI